MTGLHIVDVSHSFGQEHVLKNVSLTVQPGNLACLLGPSGSGKSTLLRIVAGLETLQQGHIIIEDQLIADGGIHTPPEKRGIGLVFQDYALFPHLSILDNVVFGLFDRSSAAARNRALEVLEQVGMASHAHDFPHVLSGGEQQRVALARALAPSPGLMLLDEPFSGLDVNMRVQIREETLGVLKESGVATLMVTHDPEEAMFMADQVCILYKDGHIVQVGTPPEIYYQPANGFVATLFGPVNKIRGVVSNSTVPSPFGNIAADGLKDGQLVEVHIRPEGLSLNDDDTEGTPVEVVSACPLGCNSHIRFKVQGEEGEGTEFHARVSGVFRPTNGKRLSVRIDERQTFVYPSE